jgi:hypothetical protein
MNSSLDHHVVDAPPSIDHVQTVVDDLGPVSRRRLERTVAGCSIERLAQESDLLTAGGLDLRQVGA